jgi:hypothetical protein
MFFFEITYSCVSDTVLTVTLAQVFRVLGGFWDAGEMRTESRLWRQQTTAMYQLDGQTTRCIRMRRWTSRTTIMRRWRMSPLWRR